jgi:hypothetical protein
MTGAVSTDMLLGRLAVTTAVSGTLTGTVSVITGSATASLTGTLSVTTADSASKVLGPLLHRLVNSLCYAA